MCVWAIDSLSGVILSGLPRGASASSKASAPKAVLWGRCGNTAPTASGTGRLRNTVPFTRAPTIRFAKPSSTNPQLSSPSMPPAPAARPAASDYPTVGGAFSSAPGMSWLYPSRLLSSQSALMPQSAQPSKSDTVLGISSYVAYPEGVPVRPCCQSTRHM